MKTGLLAWRTCLHFARNASGNLTPFHRLTMREDADASSAQTNVIEGLSHRVLDIEKS